MDAPYMLFMTDVSIARCSSQAQDPGTPAGGIYLVISHHAEFKRNNFTGMHSDGQGSAVWIRADSVPLLFSQSIFHATTGASSVDSDGLAHELEFDSSIFVDNKEGVLVYTETDRLLLFKKCSFLGNSVQMVDSPLRHKFVRVLDCSFDMEVPSHPFFIETAGNKGRVSFNLHFCEVAGANDCRAIQFCPTSAFTPSHAFLPTSKFTRTSNFSPSKKFDPTGKFTRSSSFAPSKKFAPTGKFTRSSSFAPSKAFTGTSEFVETVGQSKDLEPKGDESTTRRRKGMFWVAVGVAVGVVVLGTIVAIVVAVMIRKEDEIKESNDGNRSRETMHYGHRDELTQDNPLVETEMVSDGFSDPGL
jgi:hypothetical protein